MLGIQSASAHGGVSYEDDVCLLTIDAYRMHFTGYQPLKARAEEFCEDIPYEGQAIIVLDHVDRVLRRMPTEFRILRDVNDLGVTAKLEELGSDEDIEKATVFRKEKTLYPRGTLQVDLKLEKGKYIGLVTIHDTEKNEVYKSVFPFSVGYGLPLSWTFLIIIGGILAIVAFLAVLSLRRR